MDEQVDLKLILKELRELKELVRADLAIDQSDVNLDRSALAMEQQIADEERKIEEGTKLVVADLTGMHYVSLDAWKRMIWDACDQRHSQVTDKEIVYVCSQTGGPCKFELCPKNMARKQ